MKICKRLLSILFVNMLVIMTLVGCGNSKAGASVDDTQTEANTEITEENANADDIVILYTNDVHTYVDGPISYDVIAAVKKELQKKYGYVYLVDAGDHIQGTAYGSMDNGETIIKMMNAAGYDVATDHDW